MLPHINVYDLPKYADPDSLADGSVVVMDVLRASTTIIYSLHAGAETVIACGEIDEALDIAKKLPREKILLGGERRGLPIEGFDLGNSPEDYTPARVAGKTLIFTTTNGTQAMLHAKKARQIFIGAFVNASAIVEKLLEKLQNNENVHLICAGTDGQPTDEDRLCAGFLAEKLHQQWGSNLGQNDQAIAARRLWRHTFGTMEQSAKLPIEPKILEKTMRNSLGGQNLVNVGLDRDILAAAQIDRFAIVPKFDPISSKIQLI